MWLCKWFTIFVIYSFLGWVYETTYCMIKWKKWENRGFLYGPVCPIYGSGAVLAMLLARAVSRAGFEYTWWMVFIVCALGSIVLEYGTSYVLEKVFHARWWDYSYKKFNIHGRVCLMYTMCFGVAGVAVVYGLLPPTMRISSHISQMGFEFLGMLFMLIIGMDIALTASALSDFEEYVARADKILDEHMERFVENTKEKYATVSEEMSVKVEEEKERFSRERIAFAMSGLSKSAIRRITSFVPGKNEKESYGRMREFLRQHSFRRKGE